MWILIVIGIVFIVKEAFQEYGAEKYANRKVYEKNTDFFDFMLSNHPWILIGGIIFVVLLIVGMLFGG